MWNRLLLLWHKFRTWLVPGPAVPTRHDPMSENYQPSNLHARRYR